MAAIASDATAARARGSDSSRLIEFLPSLLAPFRSHGRMRVTNGPTTIRARCVSVSN